MKLSVAISLILSAACAVPGIAQSLKPAAWEVAVGYNFVHTNAPPTGCGCFSLNGGTASVVRQFNPSVGLAGEFDGVTNSKVDVAGHSLTLLTVLAGPRYRLVSSRGRLVPFAQILVGGAHASGGLYAASGSSSGSANAFAASMGGGVDVALNPRLSLRLVQAEYLLTLLPNAVNSRQNNFNLSTGIVIRFGAR
jgi:outer membrane immunogenic protein